ncbi:MAG: hypothetical protein LBR52_02300 [Prevotellaceae bacterium]|jgi:hypothetical protein|nr:hypothetical protein [Prevotellaceae bacterium]
MKKKKTTAAPLVKPPKMNRDNKITLSLNDKEIRVFQQFCQKYKIENRSRFLRETIMSAILKRFDEDYPTLFNENEMR